MAEKFRVGLRVEFATEQECFELFHHFHPSDLEYVLGWSRKRASRAQLILLYVERVSDAKKFMAECKKNPSVTGVQQIPEKEFWEAPSHAM